MLVLTRRLNEVIRIGDNIRLQVVGINGRSVRLAIDAPRDVAVHREEVHQRLCAERLAATCATSALTESGTVVTSV